MAREDERPYPLRDVGHHEHPLGWGGADVASNIVRVSDTTHMNAHVILARWYKAGRLLTRAETRAALGLAAGLPLQDEAYRLAVRGWAAWEAAGKPTVRNLIDPLEDAA